MTPDEIQAEIDESGGEVLPIEYLVPHDANPRKNTNAAQQLARTISEVGWGAPLLVQAGTNFIIAGHTRFKAAQIIGLERIPVRSIAIEDRRARQIALADNRVGEIADWDYDLLGPQLEEFSLMEAEALGFDAKFLESMANRLGDFGPLDDPAEHWQDMPDYENPKNYGVQTIIVHFQTEEDVRRFSEYAEQNITPKTKTVWLPKQERVDIEGEAWGVEDAE